MSSGRRVPFPSSSSGLALSGLSRRFAAQESVCTVAAFQAAKVAIQTGLMTSSSSAHLHVFCSVISQFGSKKSLCVPSEEAEVQGGQACRMAARLLGFLWLLFWNG